MLVLGSLGVRSHEPSTMTPPQQDLEQSVQVRCQNHLEPSGDVWREQMCRSLRVFVKQI